MEAEVFDKDDVAAFLNAHFVSIKVDREERPDLDAVYMEAVQSMTGGGGWPMTLFLTPSLKPFFGGVPAARSLPRAHQEGVRGVRLATARPRGQRGGSRRAALARQSRHELASDRRGRASRLGERRARAVDPQWGGFRGGTKFPTPVRWELLLHGARKWGDAPVASAVRATLDAMAAGGIRDPWRRVPPLSTDERWETPHFEKMLYDNAQLASLYAEAGLAFHEPKYVAVATDTLDFLSARCRRPPAASTRASTPTAAASKGPTTSGRATSCSASAAPPTAPSSPRILGVSGAGKFEGGPRHRTAARRSPTSPPRRAQRRGRGRALDHDAPEAPGGAGDTREAAPRYEDRHRLERPRRRGARARLRGHRRYALSRSRDQSRRLALARTPPRAVGTLPRVERGACGRARRARGLRVPRARARRALRSDERRRAARPRARARGGSRRPLRPGPSRAAGTATRRVPPRSRARVSLDDAVEPSGSAVLLATRIALGALTLRDELTQRVNAHPPRAARPRSAPTVWARRDGSTPRCSESGPFYDVVVAGDDIAAVERLTSVRRGLAPAWAVSAQVAASGPDAPFEQIVAAAHGKTAGNVPAKAYVCLEGSCKAPTSNPAPLRASLLAGWSF